MRKRLRRDRVTRICMADPLKTVPNSVAPAGRWGWSVIDLGRQGSAPARERLVFGQRRRALGIRVVLCVMAATVALGCRTASATAARVMLDGAFGRWVPASVMPLGTDTVVVVERASARTDTLPISVLGIVDVYRGRHTSGRNLVGGMLLGTLVGYVGGALLFNAQNGGCADLCGLGAVVYVGYGAAIGAGVGAVAGAMPVRSWTRVHVSPNARKWLDSHRAWP